MARSAALLLAFASLLSAREITFPPVAGVQAPLGEIGLDGFNDIDISVGNFAGLRTYANLPYAHCLGNDDVEKYDIAIMGAPFDTVCSFTRCLHFGMFVRLR